jgi:hypothetical protein
VFGLWSLLGLCCPFLRLDPLLDGARTEGILLIVFPSLLATQSI